MNPVYPTLQRHHPLRPADWRWRRARWLVEQGRYCSPHRDDEPTGRAVHYLRALARCGQDRRSRDALKRQADIGAAQRLRADNGSTRLLVEARLLAQQTSVGIALLTGVPSPVIDTYESLFFNI